MRLASVPSKKFMMTGVKNEKAPVNTGAFTLLKSSKSVHELRVFLLGFRSIILTLVTIAGRARPLFPFLIPVAFH